MPVPETLPESRGFAGGARAALFVLVVSTVCHLAFSSLGFNPTDDGFILAYSRRILDGQVPHRDFISIRPCLSPLLHLPIVWLGGGYTYWLSRWFVWLEFASIAWISTTMIERQSGSKLGRVETMLMAFISFALSANFFPICAWHTIDGLLLAFSGIWLALSRRLSWKTAGYLFLGASGLCKQNFLLLSPLALCILGNWRSWRYWIATASPLILYIGFLFPLGALPDARDQLLSQIDLYQYGIVAYAACDVGIAFGTGWLLARLLYGSADELLFSIPGNLAMWIRIATIAVGILSASVIALHFRKIVGLSFVLLGVAAGFAVFLSLKRAWLTQRLWRMALLVVGIGWVSSVSIGHNSPMLTMGPLFTLLFVCSVQRSGMFSGTRGRSTVALSCAIVVLCGFVWLRTQHIYREPPADRLVWPIDTVLPGGRFLLTNANTYDFLNDLSRAADQAQCGGKTYAILPDCAGYWVKATQGNPLCVDWAQSIELSNQLLVARVVRDLDLSRDSNVVFVQKYEAESLRNGMQALGSNEQHGGPYPRYPISEYVRQRYRKIGETDFFDIYQ